MKLYAVKIERVIMVVAGSKEDAERVAIRNEREEMFNEPEEVNAIECKTLGNVPVEWRKCYPYGDVQNITCEGHFQADNRTDPGNESGPY